MLGLGLSIPQLAARGLRLTDLAAAIRSLFAAGEQGFWYDPSDLTTLYQDAAGTTPVTAVEQPVGLMLDKSKGLVLGPELVTNGDFSNGTTGWTANTATLSVVSGQLVATSTTAYGKFIPNAAITTTPGTAYKLTFDVLTSNFSSCRVGTYSSGNNLGSVSGAGPRTYTVIFTAATTTSFLWFQLDDVSGGSCTFDNISVRELPGNHATQTTSTSRPVLSARVNLLTKTEALTDAVWNKSSGSISVTSSVLAPDGTNNAFTIKNTSGLANDFYQVVFSTKGIASVYMRRNSGSSAVQGWSGSGYGYVNYSPQPTDTWQKVSVTTGAEVNSFVIRLSPDNAVDIWHPDFRSNTDGIGLPSYQRVNTATDYDTVGFPHYLRFDGVDDFLVTNSINFTATDKMTVFAGVRKLSDLNSYVFDSNYGVVSLTGATSNGAKNYGFVSKAVYSSAPFNYASPITDVLTGIGDISGDQTILRVNGVQTASNTADQGAGNYGSYAIYIGRFTTATAYLNGHLYSLIVRGAQSTEQQIIDAERYVNDKTRAYA